MKLLTVQYTNPLTEWLWESGVMWWVIGLVVVAIMACAVMAILIGIMERRANRRADELIERLRTKGRSDQ